MPKRHQHGGRSSEAFFDVADVLTSIGLKNGDVFLDAGCGPGHFAIAACGIVGPDGRVCAVDVHEESIDKLNEKAANRNLENIDVFVADVTERIPAADQTVDVCLMANVFHGFEKQDAQNALDEMLRVLKPGGLLAIVEFKKINGPPGPPLSIRLSPNEVEQAVRPRAFKREKVFELGQYHYCLMMVKHDDQKGV